MDPNRPPLPERAEPHLTHEQYAAAIKKLGLSQVRAARFFGLSDIVGQRMANGHTKIPVAITLLLKLMIKHHLKPGDLDPNFKL